MNPTAFDDIRPYHDEELPAVYEELIADPAFQKAVSSIMPGVPFEAIAQKMRSCRTKLEFQKAFCYGLLWNIIKECVTADLPLTTLLCPIRRSRIRTFPITAILFSTRVSCRSCCSIWV